LIDTTSAAARFGLARDTIAKACREIPGVGTWRGGRWQVRVGTLGFGEPTAGEETRVRGASRAVLGLNDCINCALNRRSAVPSLGNGSSNAPCPRPNGCQHGYARRFAGIRPTTGNAGRIARTMRAMGFFPIKATRTRYWCTNLRQRQFLPGTISRQCGSLCTVTRKPEGG
jgi:hypothetical protein